MQASGDAFWQWFRNTLDNVADWAGEWVLIPALFIFIIYIADSIVRKATTGSDHAVSVRAGYWAGFIALVVFVSSTDRLFFETLLPVPQPGDPLRLDYLAAFPLGAVWGSFLVFVLKKLIPTKLGGLVVGVMVFLGSASLFTYVVYHGTGFDQVLRWWTLGHAFGILILASVSPKSISEFLPETFLNPFDRGESEDAAEPPEEETAERGAPDEHRVDKAGVTGRG